MATQTATETMMTNQTSVIDTFELTTHTPHGKDEVARQETDVECSEASDKEPTAFEKLVAAIRGYMADERGMSTIEYALGCVAAAALGALLYTVVTSDTVEQALSGIFEKALQQGKR